MVDSARQSSRGRVDDADSEADVDGIVDVPSSPFYSETGKRSRAVEEESIADVFGSIRSSTSSSSSSTPLAKKNKGKARMSGNSQIATASGGSGLRHSFLAPTPVTGVRNDIPLFDDSSDHSGVSPLPPLGAVPSVRKMSQVLIPLLPKEELAKYTYIGPKLPFLRSVEAPPTPPTTIPEHHDDRGSTPPESPYQDYSVFADQDDQAGPSRTNHDTTEDEDYQDAQPEDIDVPSRQLSSSQPPFEDAVEHLGGNPGHSSSDPIGQDWESRAGASEKRLGENGDDASDIEEISRREGSKDGNGYKDEEEMSDDEDDEMNDGDEDDFEDEEGGDSGRKKNLRNYDERREASKRTITLRLRVPTRENDESGRTSRSSPALFDSSSPQSSAMGANARPPKRKMPTRNSNGGVSTRSASIIDIEGEDEIEEIHESEFESPPRKTRARLSRNTKKGRRRSKVVEEEEESGEEVDVMRLHRGYCERCKLGPADALLAAAKLKKKRGGGRKRKKQEGDDDEFSEEETAEALQGWLECVRCVATWHWKCLGAPQQADALRYLASVEGEPAEGEKKRKDVGIDEFVNFECRSCLKSPNCMICHKPDLIPAEISQAETVNAEGEISEAAEKDKEPVKAQEDSTDTTPPRLHFRCIRCTRSAHYEHLPDPFLQEGIATLDRIADHYQQPRDGESDAWTCNQCREWIWKVDIVIAWRPLPADATEEEIGLYPCVNDDLAREYLVKFMDRGFRHTEWVPHNWLKILAPQRLRNFLITGPVLDLITDETLAAKGDEMTSPTIAKLVSSQQEVESVGGEARHHLSGGEEVWRGSGPQPDRNGKTGLPIAWSTIDRVLDIYLLPPAQKKKGHNKKIKRISSDSESEQGYQGRDGNLPASSDLVSIDDWEKMAGRQLVEGDADEIAGMVTWLFAKWEDLQYDQSTWDTPSPRDSALYPAYKRALRRYLGARNVTIPVLTPGQCKLRDQVRFRDIAPPTSQPDCIVGGQLMPFQMEGLQWLLTKHYKRESAILADDMGLGKTVQIAALLGFLGAQKIYPCLVVVPNSTITNWVREFEKWVPHMRVVPYYGEAGSRKVIREYELYHKGRQGHVEGLKAHVVLTTYDVVTSKDFKVFKNIPRWEVLCVDEGQKLKSDASLVFGNLKKLTSVHRLLLTGTPLNNNIRELFNLLNFLDPASFTDRNQLEKKFEQDSLNEDLVRELHALAQPYILRRIKDDVLRLPPKVEIIVPISLTRTQLEVYKYILESNQERLASVHAARKKRAAQKALRELGKAKAIRDAQKVAQTTEGMEGVVNSEASAPVVEEAIAEGGEVEAIKNGDDLVDQS